MTAERQVHAPTPFSDVRQHRCRSSSIGFRGGMRGRLIGSVAVLLGLAVVGATGSARGQSGGAPLNLGRYYALVIGNQQYRHVPSLNTPAKDASAVADLLPLVRRHLDHAFPIPVTVFARDETMRADRNVRQYVRGACTRRPHLLVTQPHLDASEAGA